MAIPINPKITEEILQEIQRNFHTVIMGRASKLINKYKIELPSLEMLQESMESSIWFPVPGMYGGFDFRLKE